MSELSKQFANVEILEAAIADAGYWRWWDSKLPDSVQLEFGGTQLWFPPTSPDQITSGLLAIRLCNPVLVAFLTGKVANVPSDWPEKLRCDSHEPFGLEYDRFTLSSHEAAAGYLSDAASIQPLIGSPEKLAHHKGESLLAFWAGSVGFIGIAASISLYSMHGRVDPESVPELSEKWWSYWKEYWARKRTNNPMPRDYACEVCIPIAEGK